MSIKNNVIVGSLLLLICASCSKERHVSSFGKNSPVVVDIDLDPNRMNFLEISEFIDSVKLIRLETTDECLISNVADVLFYEELMVIHDEKTRSVLIFDNDGNYKNKISALGSGPNEYRNITRVLIDEVKKQLILYDEDSRKLLFYTLDGKLIKTIADFCDRAVIQSIINLSNGNFLCYVYYYGGPSKYYGLWEVDSMGVYIRSLLTPEAIKYPLYSTGASSHLYYLPNNKIGLSCGNENDIYHYTNDSIYKYLSYKLPQKTIIDYPNTGAMDLRGDKRPATRRSNQEKGNYIFTEWLSKNMTYHISLYNKTNNNVVVARALKTHSSSMCSLPGSITNNNKPDQIVIIVAPDAIQNCLLDDENVPEATRAKVKDMVSDMSEDEIMGMNPILEVMYVKSDGSVR